MHRGGMVIVCFHWISVVVGGLCTLGSGAMGFWMIGTLGSGATGGCACFGSTGGGTLSYVSVGTLGSDGGVMDVGTWLVGWVGVGLGLGLGDGAGVGLFDAGGREVALLSIWAIWMKAFVTLDPYWRDGIVSCGLAVLCDRNRVSISSAV